MSEDNSSPPPFSETQMRWLNRFLPTQPPADPPTTSHQAAGERGVRKLGGREMGSVGPIAASPLAEPGFYYRGGQLNGRDTPSRVPTEPANACWFLGQMPEAKSFS